MAMVTTMTMMLLLVVMKITVVSMRDRLRLLTVLGSVVRACFGSRD